MDKKYLIIGAVIAIGIYFFKKGKMVNNKSYVMKKIKEIYGIAIARNVEKIFRIETGNFKHGFTGVYSAGMHPVIKTFPYGWNSLRNFWQVNSKYAPSGVKYMNEGKGLLGEGGGSKPYLKFPNFLAGAMTVAEVMKKRGNNPGSWFSTDPDRIGAYNESINKYPSTITDSV